MKDNASRIMTIYMTHDKTLMLVEIMLKVVSLTPEDTAIVSAMPTSKRSIQSPTIKNRVCIPFLSKENSLQAGLSCQERRTYQSEKLSQRKPQRHPTLKF